MTVSDRARQQAIQIEVKKDGLYQRQNGDWVLRLVLQAADLQDGITKAPMGTRYMAALVETGDNGEPVERPNTSKEREVMPVAQQRPKNVDSPPRPAHGDPKPVGADKRSWNELGPAQQAGIRCNEPAFWRFLNEEHGYRVANADEAAEAVRECCGVTSRSELATNHKARVIWHQFDATFLEWMHHPELVA